MTYDLPGYIINIWVRLLRKNKAYKGSEKESNRKLPGKRYE